MLDLIKRPRTLNDRIVSYLARAEREDASRRYPLAQRGIRHTGQIAREMRMDKTAARAALNALADAGQIARHASILDSHTWRAS